MSLNFLFEFTFALSVGIVLEFQCSIVTLSVRVNSTVFLQSCELIAGDNL